MAPVKLDYKWGFIDSLGNIMVNPIYDTVVSFYDDGYAPVVIDGKMGVITTAGNLVVANLFDKFEPDTK